MSIRINRSPLRRLARPPVTTGRPRRAPGIVKMLVESVLMLSPLIVNNLLPPSGDKNAGPAAAHAEQVIGIERVLGLDFEPALTAFLGNHPLLTDAALAYYAVMHFAITAAAAVLIAIARPRVWETMRTAFVVGSFTAILISRLYPLAPPNLLPGPWFDAAAAASHPPNPYAAMPSLHTAWALWAALAVIVAARPYDRSVRALAVAVGTAHLAATVLIVLSTGHHFVLDVIAGAAVIAFGAVVARSVRRLRLRMRRAARSAQHSRSSPAGGVTT